jgi:response regulator RpfG family c-di-GMP phosphodiesterase
MKHDSSQRILIVDDDKNLLDAMRRAYRKVFDLTVALGGEEGLEVIDNEGPFAVVVSDQQMPGMDGVTFLNRVSERSPDTVRVMLTGNADMDTAIQAVNEGQIFRFLTKPCPEDTFRAVVDSASEQFRLRQAEKLLLEGTLRGSIEVLADVLALANPDAFGRAMRIQNLVKQLVELLGMADPWVYETAALLSQIGLVAIPPDMIQKLAAGECSGEEYDQIMSRHPAVARELLSKIPRLELVSDVIAVQRMDYKDARESDLDPLVLRGGQILNLALDFEELTSMGIDPKKAAGDLEGRSGRYSPKLVSLLPKLELEAYAGVERGVTLREVHVGMLLAEDVRSDDGAVVVKKGTRISPGLLAKLYNYDELRGIVQPFRVRVGV